MWNVSLPFVPSFVTCAVRSKWMTQFHKSLLVFILLSLVHLGKFSTGFDGDERQCEDRNLGHCDFSPSDDDSASPLILTRYLKSGRIQEAREASRVEACNASSHSGFFTVDEKHNSNVHFWFFPYQKSSVPNQSYDVPNGDSCTAKRDIEVPLLLWMSGGPGLSSLFGLFIEIGPYVVSENLKLVPKKYSWTSTHSVLFLDPVGSGFSFSDPGGEITNSFQVGEQVYKALLQFFTIFPDFLDTPVIFCGESYASKYLAIAGSLILNPSAPVKINLSGIAIGNTYLTHPEVMMDYHNTLYYAGLIGPKGREEVERLDRRIVQHIRSGWYEGAVEDFEKLILGQNATLFGNLTGFSNLYNILFAEDPVKRDIPLVENFLSLPITLDAIHVGERRSKFVIRNKEVLKNMKGDLMRSVKPLYEYILNIGCRVMFYSGNLDIVAPPPITEKVISALEWVGKVDYERAPRTGWYVDGALAGEFQQSGALTFVVVRNSGHFVSKEQPAWALDLITRFTRSQRFN